MSLRRVVMLGITAVLAATPAAAQQRGTIELQGFGRYTLFDNTLLVDDKFGGGGRLGFFIFPRLILEADASYTSTTGPLGSSVSYLPIHAYLTYNQPLSDRIAALLGAGYVHNEYGADVEGSDNGVAGLFGLRFLFAGPLALRIDGTVDYIPSPANLATENWHYGVQAGLSLVIGRLRGGGGGDRDLMLDADSDGVANQFDACPGTGFGVEVDGSGCPLAEERLADEDGDGVEDADDACPDTPADANVDAEGCPLPQDSDGDGVPDTNDACPNTRAGARVDARGCPPPVAPVDADGDGVSDSRDTCPNTPAGARVDARGCPLPADADGDGVTDADDACPNTRAGVSVDTRGCPVAAPTPTPTPPPADRDGDGVPDAGDACPNTPGGQRVDVRGCPIMIEVREVAPPPGEAGPVPAGVLQGVTFRGGTAVLSPESRAALDQVARSLLANPSVRVEIAGFTDSTGSQALNMSLSQARANMVRWYLIDRGVPGARMMARGYGPENPIASNDTPQGRAQNRRVELRRIN